MIAFRRDRDCRLFGKGRKERLCPLWPQTAEVLRDLCAERHIDLRVATPVFLNHRGHPLTRFGVRYLLAKYLRGARSTTPALNGKRLHPHSIRHSTAVHLLKAGVDLSTICQWLGHASPTTTNRYAAVDLDMKREALARAHAPDDSLQLVRAIRLRNPNQPSIRAWNYTEVGINLQVGGTGNQPCVISGGCTQIPVSKSVCEDNNGVWWGAGADAPETEGIPAQGYTYCCQVNAFRDAEGQSLYNITPLVSVGIRNDRYKIVQNQFQAYVSQAEPCVESTETEFYAIDEAVPLPRLDREDTNFPLDDLDADQQANYDALSAQLQAIRDSVPDCPGDGNSDFVVDNLDLDDWRFYADSTGLSSWYDLNTDGLTNDDDKTIIEDNLGLVCTGG